MKGILKPILLTIPLGLAFTGCIYLIIAILKNPVMAALPTSFIVTFMVATTIIFGGIIMAIMKKAEKKQKRKLIKLEESFNKTSAKILENQRLTSREQKMHKQYIKTKNASVESDLEKLKYYLKCFKINEGKLFTLGTVENENMKEPDINRHYVSRDFLTTIKDLKAEIYSSILDIENHKAVKASLLLGSFTGDDSRVKIENNWWKDKESLNSAKSDLNFYYENFTFYSREQGESIIKFLDRYTEKMQNNPKLSPKNRGFNYTNTSFQSGINSKEQDDMYIK